jgi:hypothetical protein
MKVNEIINESPKAIFDKGVDLLDKGVAAYKGREAKKAADAAKKARDKTMRNWYGGKIDITKLSRRERTDLIKKRAEAGTKAREAAAAYSTMDKGISYGVNALGLTAATIEYYSTSKQVEEEYNLYTSNREESMYSAAETVQDAYRYFQSDLNLATGTFIASVALVFTKTPASKLLDLLSGRFGLALAALVGAAVGAGVGMSSGADDAAERGAGAAVGAGVALAGVAFIRKKFLPFLKGGKVDAATKGIIIAFLNSDEGHKWLENSVVGSAVRVIGGAFKPYIDTAAEYLKAYPRWAPFAEPVRAAGGVLNPTAGTKPPAKTQAQQDQEKQDAADAKANAGIPYSLQSWTENGVTFVGGKAVTDANGKLLPGLKALMDRAAITAKQSNAPNPFDKIAKPANYSPTAY